MKSVVLDGTGLRSQNQQCSPQDQKKGSRMMPSGYGVMARVGSLPSNSPALNYNADYDDNSRSKRIHDQSDVIT